MSTGSLNVTFRTLEVALYTADCIAGGVVSVYDMARVRLAAFWTFQPSVVPLASMVTLRGWPRLPNDAISAGLSCMVKVSALWDGVADTDISEEVPFSRILSGAGACTAALIDTESAPDVLLYAADRMVTGGASTPDIVDVSVAEFGLPHTSVTPPGSTSTLRTLSRASIDDFWPLVSVAASMPAPPSANALAGRVRLPVLVELYTTTLVESCADRASDSVSVSMPEETLYMAEDSVGGVASGAAPSNIAAPTLGLAGSVMSIICTALSPLPATRAYVLPDDVVVVMKAAPFRAVNPSWPSNMAAVAVGEEGVLMSIICTALSPLPATRAYVLPDIATVSTYWGLLRAVNPPCPSNMAAVLAGEEGVLMSVICTPWSMVPPARAYVLPDIATVSRWVTPSSGPYMLWENLTLATAVGEEGVLMSVICTADLVSLVVRAYVLPDMVAVSTEIRPSRIKLSTLCRATAVRAGLEGSVTLIIDSASSLRLGTKAYVSPDIATVLTERGSCRASYTLPSVRAAAGAGLAGEVMLIICTPSSSLLATRAYVSPDIVAAVTKVGPSSSENPPVPLNMTATGEGLAGEVTLIICTASSDSPATRAYVLPDIVTISMASAPPSPSNVVGDCAAACAVACSVACAAAIPAPPAPATSMVRVRVPSLVLLCMSDTPPGCIVTRVGGCVEPNRSWDSPAKETANESFWWIKEPNPTWPPGPVTCTLSMTGLDMASLNDTSSTLDVAL